MDTFIVRNPWTGDEAAVEATSVAELSGLVTAARAAQPGWAATPLAQRLAVIQRAADLLGARQDALARLLTHETGKPLRQAQSELQATQARIRALADLTPDAVAPRTVRDDAPWVERVTYAPLGVIANISAWNYPYFVSSNVLVPALATGNAALFKPSELAPHTGLALAEALWDAGVPRDALACVQGGREVGQRLLEQRLNGVFFTGSYATGVAIARARAPHLGALQLELGGKDPVYVHHDVDVEAVAAAVADGAFYNAGQSCCSVERVYVHEAVHAPFTDALVRAARAHVLGDPRDPSTTLGPLARAAQLDVLQAQVDDAVAKGARLLCGGARWSEHPGVFLPTVLDRATHAMSVMRDESFGPVLPVAAVPSADSARALMADTPYGLTAGVYARDRDVALGLLDRLDVGSAYWNCCDRVSPRLPWTGRGHSGVGSTLGHDGIRAFVHPKSWHLRADA